MKYKEIYDIVLPEKKRKEEKHNLFGHYIGRPISILMTIPLIDKPITPTDVTKVSMIVALIGFCFVAFGNTVLLRSIGWLFFFLWNLLDGVDGNLARCTNRCSQKGDLWDTTAGYAAMVLTYFSAGIAAYYDSNLLNIGPQHIMLILGGATAIFAIFPRLILQKKKSYGEQSKDIDEFTDTTNASSFRKAVGNIASPTGLMQVFLLIAILTHTLNIFTLLYFIFNLLAMMYSLAKLLN